MATSEEFERMLTALKDPLAQVLRESSLDAVTGYPLSGPHFMKQGVHYTPIVGKDAFTTKEIADRQGSARIGFEGLDWWTITQVGSMIVAVKKMPGGRRQTTFVIGNPDLLVPVEDPFEDHTDRMARLDQEDADAGLG